MAKWQGMSAGEIRLPMGVRVSIGNKYGAQHSQDLTHMMYGVPGILISCPATPYDAKVQTTALLNQDNPWLQVESQVSYGLTSKKIREEYGLDIPDMPFEETSCVIGRPDVVRKGEDVTLLAFGAGLYTAAEAAKELEAYGVSAEIINGKWLVPFEYETVMESVRKTGKIVLISHAPERGSPIKDIAENISELGWEQGALDGQVVTVGARNTITPGKRNEDEYFPQSHWILDRMHFAWETIGTSKFSDYQPVNDFYAPGNRSARAMKAV